MRLVNLREVVVFGSRCSEVVVKFVFYEGCTESSGNKGSWLRNVNMSSVVNCAPLEE